MKEVRIKDPSAMSDRREVLCFKSALKTLAASALGMACIPIVMGAALTYFG